MRFIESILFENGLYHNLSLHQKRFDLTLKEHLVNQRVPRLSEILPALELEGSYKVRMVYGLVEDTVAFDVEYAEYAPRKIQSLAVIKSSTFDYSFKFEDRSAIDRLLAQSDADDIIISMNRKITDGSYFNLALWDGSEWLTPDTPLLNGVRRQQLLSERKIKEVPLKVSDLDSFEKVSLINAMLNLGDVEVPTSSVLR